MHTFLAGWSSKSVPSLRARLRTMVAGASDTSCHTDRNSVFNEFIITYYTLVYLQYTYLSIETVYCWGHIWYRWIPKANSTKRGMYKTLNAKRTPRQWLPLAMWALISFLLNLLNRHFQTFDIISRYYLKYPC